MAEDLSPPPGPSTLFAALAAIVLADDSQSSLLQRAVRAARDGLDRVDDVSIAVGRGRLTTPACTGPLARSGDLAQYASGQGPCFEALRSGGAVLVDDMTAETRWGYYTPHAIEAGIGSSLSLPLGGSAARPKASLNLYSRQRHTFRGAVIDTAVELAGLLTLMLANPGLYDGSAEATRAAVGRATGRLTADGSCTEAEAASELVRRVVTSGRSFDDVAAEVTA